MRGDSSLNDCDATCYFCLEKGPDESGQPLRRDCSCRGESTGFAHLSCIVKYAKQKSQLIQDWEDHHELEGPWEELTEPWDCCPSCKQQYQNELAVDLADEFVTFVEDRYPGDKKKHLWSRYRELVALTSMETNDVQPQRTNEAKLNATRLLSDIEQMKMEHPSLPNDILQMEADVHNRLGHIALGEGTSEGASLHFEKCRDLYRSVGSDEGVAIVEANIARIPVLDDDLAAAILPLSGNNHRCPAEKLPPVERADVINIIPFSRRSPGTEHSNDLKLQISKNVIAGDHLAEEGGHAVNLLPPIICDGINRRKVLESAAIVEAIAMSYYHSARTPAKIVVNNVLRFGEESSDTKFLFEMIHEIAKQSGRDISVVLVECHAPESTFNFADSESPVSIPVAFSRAAEERAECQHRANTALNQQLARLSDHKHAREETGFRVKAKCRPVSTT